MVLALIQEQSTASSQPVERPSIAFRKGEIAVTYRIIPLVLAKYTGEKGGMTLFTDYGKDILRPFIVWFIEGAEKKILVDTGIEAVDYGNYYPQNKDRNIQSIMTFEEALGSVNLTPDQIDIVIQTHLHFDHCYNTSKCPNAKVFVQDDELRFARNPVPYQAMYRNSIFENLCFEIIQGDYNLFDGIDILSLPGHSAGGQGVCVETEKGRVVISSMCNINENYYPEKVNPAAPEGSVILPGVILDAVKAYHSMMRIKNAADIILPLHEPEILGMKSIP